MHTCYRADHMLSLRAILPEAEFLAADDIHVLRTTSDSRRVRPGDLFAALPGTRSDGHMFITEAMHQGASAVLCANPPEESRVPVCIVPDVPHAYGRICQALAGNPSKSMKVIGITGTNGKTTTSCLVTSVLRKSGIRVGLLGTLGYFDGEEVESASHTTPPADVLAAWLGRMVTNNCTHAVMEVSSHALAQSRLAGVSLNVACVTNVTRDHLDYHPTIHDYRATKAKVLNCLSPEGFAVINADDAVANSFLTRFNGPALTIGIDNDAEIMATPFEQFASEQTFLLTAGSETIPVRTRMIGMHHIYNCLTATAVGLSYGISLTSIVRGLEAVEYVPGRLQRIECGQPFSVFVDYAHTPDALTRCLNTLRATTEGRLLCVFGAGGNRDQKKRPLMGRAVEYAADLAIITSDNPRHEDPRDIIEDIRSGFERPSAAKAIVDRAQAIRSALALARSGDCVLIAGKGHEHYQIIGDERVELDDCEIAQQWLYQSATGSN